MTKYSLIFTLIVWLGLNQVKAQEQTKDLPIADYYRLVIDNHPFVRTAQLLNEQGEMVVQEAKGAFDPKLMSRFTSKNFGGKDYYDIWNTYLEVPILLNMNLKAGYENNQGEFLNPERRVPDQGLVYFGISAPLGKGLVQNERSINRKRSVFIQKNQQNKGQAVLNNLFLDANHAYWWWYETYQKRQAILSNLALIQTRFEGVRTSVLSQELAAIDSVEAYINVQNGLNALQSAELELANSELLLQNFIWQDDVSLETLVPDSTAILDYNSLNDYLSFAIANHPKLRTLIADSNILVLNQKLSREQLKPEINVSYDMLIPGNGLSTENGSAFSNYKLSAQFAFPVLIRKERAKLKVAELKQEQNQLDINMESRAILNKIQQAYNKVLTMEQMIIQQEAMVINYQTMLRAEEIMFENGESSIFLLNSRANKKLAGEIKLLELQGKYWRTIAELKWSAGNLYDEIMRKLDSPT